MANKKLLTASLLLLMFYMCTLQSSAQKKENYFNEKMELVSKEEFDRRFKSNLFVKAEWINGDSHNYKLRFIGFFGELDSIKNHQLRQFLSDRIDIDKNKLWQISYFDTLPNTKQMREQSAFVYVDTLNQDTIYSIKRISWSDKRYDLDRLKMTGYVHGFDDFTRLFTKKKKHRTRKKNSFWLYDYNKEFPLNRIKKLNVFKDPKGIVRRLFNDGQIPYKLIILYPDGKFYVTSHDNPYRADLTKRKIYDKVKLKWLESLNNLD